MIQMAKDFVFIGEVSLKKYNISGDWNVWRTREVEKLEILGASYGIS